MALEVRKHATQNSLSSVVCEAHELGIISTLKISEAGIEW